jgi:DNA-directed RNA polymerase III subunit RPC4
MSIFAASELYLPKKFPRRKTERMIQKTRRKREDYQGMSDQINSRLDSLSRRATPSASAGGSKPGTRFRPKVVARRSKEERDADAPVNAPEDRPRPQRGGMRGGRGGARGGRRAMQGTHIVQAGPLASGNVLGDTKQNLSRSATMSPTPEYLTNLVKREGGSTRGTSVGPDNSDDENDLTKINMNEEYKFSKEETELFPVRAPRSHTDQEIVDVNNRSVSPDVEGKVVDVKEEEGTELVQVLKEKDTQLQNKLDQLQLDESAEDELKMSQDHRDIIQTIKDIDNTKDTFLMFQLPRVLPTFETPNAVKAEEGAAPQLEGTVASLRMHASGKLTMKIGNVVMDVSKGSNAAFLQQLVAVKNSREPEKPKDDEDMNVDEETKGTYLMGHVREKIVVTPKFV